jgi:pyruvate formate lyase activating enzyme
MTRRRFMQSVGLGACALGASWLAAKSHQEAGKWLLGWPATDGQAAGGPVLGEAAASVRELGPFARPARFYTALDPRGDCASCHTGAAALDYVGYCHTPHAPGTVRCDLCPHGCVIADGHRGHCGVRENRGGTLYTLDYGNLCTAEIDPIEKKPFFHFLPTSAAYSVALPGCSLDCLYCQNWQISQAAPEELDAIPAEPLRLAAMAADSGCPVLAYTYSEPSVAIEYVVEAARAARAAGLRNVFVSAGYVNPAPLRALCQVVDAVKVDLKGFDDGFYRKVCGGELAPVLEAVKAVHESGRHLEIVNLVVPTLNDASDDLRRLCAWVVDSLGPDVPLHFSRFHPDYRLTDLPATPLETLDRAYQLAKSAGCHFPYVGNVPGHPGNNTVCPGCGRVIVRREGFEVLAYDIVDGACRFCHRSIPGVWGPVTLASSEGS